MVEGCTDSEADNYVPYANVDDNSCVFTTPISGCTDSSACNYDTSATVDNGSCFYIEEGYDCDGNCIDTDADGVCNFDEISGCTDSFSLNYNPLATEDDGSCVATVEGCTDNNATNYNPSANFDVGCTYLQGGCTNPNANNYDSGADFDDDTCIVEGCTSYNATNYNPNATIGDGSCIFPFDVESAADNFFEIGLGDEGFDCMPIDYDSYLDVFWEAYQDDYVGGSIDDLEDYLLDNPDMYPMCEPISGCTNPNATNYNPNATVDSGGCQYPQGCTDPTAENYDSNALENDGSCDYISNQDEDFMNYWLLEIAETTNVSELDEWELLYFAPFFGPENIVDNNGDVVTGVNYPQVNGIAEFESVTSRCYSRFLCSNKCFIIIRKSCIFRLYVWNYGY